MRSTAEAIRFPGLITIRIAHPNGVIEHMRHNEQFAAIRETTDTVVQQGGRKKVEMAADALLAQFLLQWKRRPHDRIRLENRIVMFALHREMIDPDFASAVLSGGIALIELAYGLAGYVLKPGRHRLHHRAKLPIANMPAGGTVIRRASDLDPRRGG